MNIPLIIGESCLKINERIREVINELEVKSANFSGVDQEIINKCIIRLNYLNDEIYKQILGEFLESIKVETQLNDELKIENTISDILKVISTNFNKIDDEKHQEMFRTIRDLDNEESLNELLKNVIRGFETKN
jgi:hypothetical protein